MSYWLISIIACIFITRLYALHLIHFMVRFDVLESIFFALINNCKALLVVLLMACFLGYNFAFIFFSHY